MQRMIRLSSWLTIPQTVPLKQDENVISHIWSYLTCIFSTFCRAIGFRMAMIYGPVWGRKRPCFVACRHVAHIFEYTTLSCNGLALTINEEDSID